MSNSLHQAVERGSQIEGAMLMRTLYAEPITAEAFAPFGVLMHAPTGPARLYYDEGLESARPWARASFSLCRAAPTALPLTVERMERHAFSSQSFCPMNDARYLVIVAPHAREGGPDGELARAFIAATGQGVTYRRNVWHSPLTVLDNTGDFVILMWRDGSSGDEEFVTLAEPFGVALAEG